MVVYTGKFHPIPGNQRQVDLCEFYVSQVSLVSPCFKQQMNNNNRIQTNRACALVQQVKELEVLVAEPDSLNSIKDEHLVPS